MDLQLQGRLALVLGGTRGLGLACAQALAAEGVSLILNGRDPAHGATVAAGLARPADGVRCDFAAGDLGTADGRAAVIAAVASLGQPDIVVTNAGGPPAGPFSATDAGMWQRAFETSIAGPLEIVRAMLLAMRERRFGRILNITSFVVKELYPNMSLSNSMRVGLTGAMGAIAREVAVDGITVNGLLPGLMDTGALQRVIRDRMNREGATEAAVRAAMADGIPQRRLGLAGDFGPLCAFLASPLAAYITGQNICIDGGLTKNVI